MTARTTDSVQIERDFQAPASDVFDAWLDPAVIPLWMFANNPNARLIATVDARERGTFSILEFNGNEQIDHFGEYLEIDRPRRLVFTLKVPKHFPGTTRITVEIAKRLFGCHLRFTQLGVRPEVTERAWREMFNVLERMAASRR